MRNCPVSLSNPLFLQLIRRDFVALSNLVQLVVIEALKGSEDWKAFSEKLSPVGRCQIYWCPNTVGTQSCWREASADLPGIDVESGGLSRFGSKHPFRPFSDI